MENVKLIENKTPKNEIQTTTKIISCECGSKLKYNSYLAHIRNKNIYVICKIKTTINLNRL